MLMLLMLMIHVTCRCLWIVHSNAGNRYTSVSLGIFLCTECAMIHCQMLGEGISEVYSLNFDTPNKAPDTPKLFDRLSNPHGVTV
jgi:hypothetical protein